MSKKRRAAERPGPFFGVAGFISAENSSIGNDLQPVAGKEKKTSLNYFCL
ncbi:hypothetical protein QW131_03760 [Roseibium salinum]|nr:hypothetical protein [Roseibium salinum]